MNIYDISTISPKRIAVNCCSFLRYTHSSRGHVIRGRVRSAFTCVTSGRFHDRFEGGELTLKKGDVAYLPEGSYYQYEVEQGCTECLQIEAEISVDGEPAAFCDHPIKSVKDFAHTRYVMERLERGFGQMERTAAVFSLLENILMENYTSISPAILPAVQYLDAHCYESFLMQEVASVCNMSQSQIRRLFRKELGMSPIEYKNLRRIECACDMLCYTNNSVSAIADTLGFDNVYIFSRVFRKYKGTSPTQYRKDKM